MKYEALPEIMKNEVVYEYYQMLQKKKLTLFFKRIFDIFLSFILLILLSPLFIIVAIFIKLTSKGPVFYRQTRIKRYYRPFKIFKFRTMIKDADKVGTEVTIFNDKRVTKVGKFLRRTRLDEIPQLINILLGDMSFVGPRPEVKKYVDSYNDEMLATLLVRQGVTCPACIKFKHEDKLLQNAENIDEAYIKEILPEKMKHNYRYLKKINFFRDIWIMIKTVL